MKPLILPEPIAAYFAADKREPDDLARCFTAEATVTDEGHTHAGLDAIKAWKAAASTAYTYRVEPFALDRQGCLQVVRSRVTGNFPGGTVDLQYRFRLERNLIASLEITV